MKITTNNYLEATANIDFTKFGTDFMDSHLYSVENLKFYGQDKDIDSAIDGQIEIVNALIGSGQLKLPSSKPAKKPKSEFTPKARGKKPVKKQDRKISKPFVNLADLKKRLKPDDVLYFSYLHDGKWIKERMRRVVSRVQSKSIAMFTPEGKESWLHDLSAKNMDFQSDYFSVSLDNDVVMVYSYTDSNPLNQPKPQSPKPEKTTKPKAEKQDKPPKAPKTQSQKPKTEKAQPKWAPAEPEGFSYVFHIPPSVAYAQRFVKMNGKEVTYDQLRKLHTALSKAFVQGRTGKADADKVAEKVHSFLEQNLANIKPGQTTRLSIAEKAYEDMVAKTGGYKVYPHVALLSSFFALQGTAPDKKKAESLSKRIETYLNKEKPRKATYLKEAHDALNRYANGKADTVKVSNKIAQGLDGFLAGCGCNHRAGLSGVATYGDVMGTDRRGIGLRGSWKRFIGDPSLGFALMLYGKPGHGKSTIAMRFANYLAQSARVMYVNSEEMKQTGNGVTISPTMADKLARSGAKRENLHFSPSVDAFDHSDYDFVFVDSVNGEKLGYEDFSALREENPNVNYVLIMQTTKDGNFRGTQEWAHLVDIVVFVEDGTATVNKNRFGAMGSYGL